MVRVSKKKPKKEIMAKIINQLIQTIAGLSQTKEADEFLASFLSKSEKIMLAKRLAIILMLEYGYSFRAIRKTLKVSQSTIAKIWKQLKKEQTPVSLKSSKSKKQIDNLLKLIEDLLNLPPIAGPGRWRRLDEMYKK